MTTSLSTGKVAILRRLAHGPIPLEAFRHLDQRPLRALFVYDRAFDLDQRFTATINQTGWDLYRRFFTGKPIMRSAKSIKNPTFLEARDARKKTRKRA